jgi:hypothetical protein
MRETMTKKRRTPTEGQLDAAIEGARDMPEASRGPGRVVGPGESPIDPSQETGGPRGSGYPPSRTTGGRLDPEGDPHGVEPDEAIKRDTAVFIPGTHGRKPQKG